MSDQKPLDSILGKPLAKAPRRLQKMFMRLQRYDVDIHYNKGTETYLAEPSADTKVNVKRMSEFEIEHVPKMEDIN